MSTSIVGSFSATVLTGWSLKEPPAGKQYTGKPCHELRAKLDDRFMSSGQRWEGQLIAVRSYKPKEYLTDFLPGARVFVSGQVEAKPFMSKLGKPAAFILVIATDVTQETSEQISAIVAEIDSATKARDAARDDDIPF
jgi:hypothetical protein